MSSVPEPLQQKTVEARLIRMKIWNRLWKDNEHFMAAIVGREGSGKSYTGLKLAEVSDPTFDAERVMFEPSSFLERLTTWKEAGETQGKLVVADEAGVGLGVRTWYDEDQIAFNKVLQVIRDENMGLIFTLPRLNELDSQTRGRLHAFIEMTDKEPGDWAEFRWLNWDPTRDERDDIYRYYPKLKIDGAKRKVKRCKISPPSEELVSDYEKRKSAFQQDLYEEVLADMEDEQEDGPTVKEIAMDLADGGMESIVSQHSQNKQAYINADLIRAHYELTNKDAKTVKAMLEQQFSSEDLQQYV